MPLTKRLLLNGSATAFIFCTLSLILFSACNSKHAAPVSGSPPKRQVRKKYNSDAGRILFADSASFANRPYKPDKLIDPAISDTAALFSKPDSASSIISVLPPFTQISMLDTIEVKRAQDSIQNGENNPQTNYYPRYDYWIKVKTTNNVEGYISEHAVAKYVFTDPARKIAYLILTFPSKLNPEQQLTVLQYDLAKKKILSSVTHWYYSDYELDVKRIESTPLKKIKMLISIHMHGDFCGGGESTILAADAGGKLFLFPDQYNSFSDGEYFEGGTLYVPYNYKGRLFLLANNDESKLAYPSEALLPYPSYVNVPNDALLVMKTSQGEYKVDKDGERMVDKKGYDQIKSLKKETTYYRWDGVQIQKIKSVVKKEK